MQWKAGEVPLQGLGSFGSGSAMGFKSIATRSNRTASGNATIVSMATAACLDRPSTTGPSTTSPNVDGVEPRRASGSKFAGS